MATHWYRCYYRSINYGEKICLRAHGEDLDTIITGIILPKLQAPPRAAFKQMLEENVNAEEIKKAHTEAERQRLKQKVDRLRVQIEHVDPVDRAFQDFVRQLNTSLKEQDAFEERLVAEISEPEPQVTEQQLNELCDLAAEIPKIWRNKRVTTIEKSQILQCLVKEIKISQDEDIIEGSINWRAGGATPFRLYRRSAYSILVRELHKEGCTTEEICERLASGATSTGQRFTFKPKHFWRVYKRLGLKPNPKRSTVASLHEEAVERHNNGETCQQIANDFKRRGLKTAKGKEWTLKLVYNLLGEFKKPTHLDALHREILINGRGKGFTFRQLVEELTRQGIPRYNGRAWHKEAVARKWRAIIRNEPALAALNKSRSVDG